MMRRRRRGVSRLEMRHLHRGWNQVVHQRAAEAVAFLVERDDLHQRHPDTVDQAAVYLTLDDHRVDAGAAVVDGEEAPHLDHRGAGIDVDDAEVRAVRIGEILRVVTDLGIESALDALGRSPAPCARIAMSWIVTDADGSPLTWKDPFSH